MPDGLQLAGAFSLSLVAALVLVPLAMRIAWRTDFVDVPGGYKGHAMATPYLGGLAVVLAVAAALFTFGAATSRFAALFVWAFVLFVVGTIDDKRNLNPFPRMLIEAFAGLALWNYGLGWTVFSSEILNIALTVIWVVGLVNAFNLMDNMDGTASGMAGVAAAGIAALGLVYGDTALVVMGAAVAGACLGFLRYNLARPAKIFLGDGGSMPLGFVVAGAVMAVPGTGEFGWSAFLAIVPMFGLPILDTALVVISRRRGGRPILSGGRDHLTHRLRPVVGSVTAVVVTLALVQTLLCLSALALLQASALFVVIGALTFAGAGAFVIYVLETPGRGRRLALVSSALPPEQAAPEKSAA